MKKLLLPIICILFASKLSAQDLKVDWSKKIDYDRMSTGSLEEFAGANDQYVYVIFNPTFKKIGKKQKQLIAYEKNSMKQLGKITLKAEEKYKDICVTKDAVYVMFTDDQKGREVLYVQTYTPTLTLINRKKKVYSTITSTKNNSQYIQSVKTLINYNANNNLYIIAEKPVTKGENVQLEYTILDKNLTQVNTGKITLPVEAEHTTSDNLSLYSIGDDGKIIVKNSIRADHALRKIEKIYSYAILSIIDPVSNVITSLPIKANGKHIGAFQSFSQNGKLHVVGFYHDNQGKRSERGNGVFSSILNTNSGELEDVKFSEISDKKINFGILYLEKLKHDSLGNTFLYATEDQNIVTVTRDAKGNTTRSYQNIKGDVLSVCLKPDGELKWNNLLERKIVYDELYVRDIQVINGSEYAYLTYADRHRKSKFRGFWNKKNKKTMKDELTYSKTDNSNGKMELKTEKLNNSNADKNTYKYVNARRLYEIDNTLYLDGYDPKIKTGVKILGCTTAPLCGLGCLYFLIKANNGSAYQGGGYLGSIKLK